MSKQDKANYKKKFMPKIQLRNNEIRLAIHYAYEQATTLAKDILEIVINTQIHDLMTISEDEEEDLEVENEIEQPANL
ncbi:7964_t:CDS:2 [Dentiscutata heterogama]|uniref:7964_t:CDS:1 n=1 Tax=Dentiscutata heterogama TaxID=1316150 RepID=A0ACA9L2S5_9GLOM|nr:7964_t:CDS:2 [Dentiscutata heterogama]